MTEAPATPTYHFGVHTFVFMVTFVLAIVMRDQAFPAENAPDWVKVWTLCPFLLAQTPIFSLVAKLIGDPVGPVTFSAASVAIVIPALVWAVNLMG